MIPSALDGLAWRMQRAIARRLIALSPDPRPASLPFVSGDGFRKLAQHVHEAGRPIDPAAVRRGEVVFVESGLVDAFFADVHPRIRDPYVLVTHNGDRNVSEADLRHVDGKIIAWFAQNALARHPKLAPIPIGLENASLANAGAPRLYEAARKNLPAERNGRILAAFSVHTNPAERGPALAALRAMPAADVVSRVQSQRSYLDLLAKYSFVASPPGNGEDCIRTWEAMLVGTVPVVKRSACVEAFRALGLPMLVVDSWDEVSALSAPELQGAYRSITGDAATAPLFFEYWADRIRETAKRGVLV